MEFIDLKTQAKRIEANVLARIKQIMDHGAYIMGPEVTEVETALSRYVGAKYALTVASGTDALLIALMALEVGPGDEIITPAFSFFATAEVIALLGAKPVFVDIDPTTYHMDVALMEAAITKKTKAIIPVSLYGQCADFDAINALAAKYNLPVIEDAAQSFGAKYNDRFSCNLSTISCTSFFPSKPLGCYGDGGACFTNDPELADRMRAIRVHGQSKRYYHTQLGINGRFDTIQAAVLLEKLSLFPEEIRLREEVAGRYQQMLSPFVCTPKTMPHRTNVYAQYTVEVANRDEVQQKLQERGIPTAVHYPLGLHEQPIFKKLYPGAISLPHTEHAARRVMSLPMHPYLTKDDQALVVHGLLDVLKETENELVTA